MKRTVFTKEGWRRLAQEIVDNDAMSEDFDQVEGVPKMVDIEGDTSLMEDEHFTIDDLVLWAMEESYLAPNPYSKLNVGPAVWNDNDALKIVNYNLEDGGYKPLNYDQFNKVKKRVWDSFLEITKSHN